MSNYALSSLFQTICLNNQKYNWNFLVGKVVERGILTRDERKGDNGEVPDTSQTKAEKARK